MPSQSQQEDCQGEAGGTDSSDYLAQESGAHGNPTMQSLIAQQTLEKDEQERSMAAPWLLPTALSVVSKSVGNGEVKP